MPAQTGCSALRRLLHQLEEFVTFDDDWADDSTGVAAAAAAARELAARDPLDVMMKARALRGKTFTVRGPPYSPSQCCSGRLSRSGCHVHWFIKFGICRASTT